MVVSPDDAGHGFRPIIPRPPARVRENARRRAVCPSRGRPAPEAARRRPAASPPPAACLWRVTNRDGATPSGVRGHARGDFFAHDLVRPFPRPAGGVPPYHTTSRVVSGCGGGNARSGLPTPALRRHGIPFDTAAGPVISTPYRKVT